MRYGFILAALAIVALAYFAGDGPGLMKSAIQGFGWGIGREVAHGVVHHVLH